jgi:glycosyltransferase involved in cell wall biosynthesis
VKISAVIPTFNRRKYIRRAIDSILAQTVAVDEIIVVDDGSTDGTAEDVEACYGSLVRIVRQNNGGVSAARLRGIQEARGEWIAFLDSDDEWTPERTKHLVLAAARVPEDVAWIFGDLRVVTDQGDGTTLFGEYGLSLTDYPELFADSLRVQYPYHFPMLQGSFVRRTALLELNCFATGLRSDDDLLAGFQISSRYRLAAIPVIVGKLYRTSDLAASSVVVNGTFRPDYFRARMLAFSLVIEAGRRRPWNMLYADEVRGLCQVLADEGPVPRRLVIEQFRFGGASLKGVAFFVVAMFGRRAIQTWNSLGAWRRKHSRRKVATSGEKGGHRGWAQSLPATKPNSSLLLATVRAPLSLQDEALDE